MVETAVSFSVPVLFEEFFLLQNLNHERKFTGFFVVDFLNEP